MKRFTVQAAGVFAAALIGIITMVSGCKSSTEPLDPTSINVLNQKDIYEPIIKSMKKADKNTFVMCHFSDIHGSRENGERLFEFLDNYKSDLDCIFCSGDVVSDTYHDDFSYWGELDTKDVMFCIGNHDSTREDGTVPAKECFERYLSPYVEGWDVVRPSTCQDEKCYYYKDYEAFGLRLVFLDSIHFDEEQKEWMNAVLEECLGNGLSVICICHFPPGKITHSGNCFDSYNYCSWMEDGSFAKPIWDFGAAAAPVVNSFIERGGKFVTWLFGHIHIDICGYVKDFPNQFCVGVAETLWRDNYTGTFSDIERKYGEKSQDLFNIVGVNTVDKTICLLRVGADFTRENTERFKLKWNYANNEQVDW